MASHLAVTQTACGATLRLTPARTSIAAVFGSLILSGLIWFLALTLVDAAWPGHDWLSMVVLGLNLLRQGYLYGSDWLARKPAILDVSPAGIEQNGTLLAKADIADVGVAMHRSGFFLPANTRLVRTRTLEQQIGRDAALLLMGLLCWPIRRQALRSHSIVITGTGDLGQRHLAYGLDGPTAANAARVICDILARPGADSIDDAEQEDDGSDTVIAGAVGVVVGAVVEGIISAL